MQGQVLTCPCTQVAKRFAQAGHPVALLSRQQSRLEGLATEINSLKIGRAEAFSADATDSKSLSTAFNNIHQKFSGASIWGGVFNSGGFLRGTVLDTTQEQFIEVLHTQALGGFLFSQQILKAIQARKDSSTSSSEPDGFLAITGATASIKGSANFAAFGASKAALRSLSQSLAREWGPKGAHVFHTIVDGIIDTDRTRGFLGGDFKENSRFDTQDLAETYYHIATQRKSTWTQEIDLRPHSETF